MAFSDTCLMFSVAIMNLICGILGALIFCLAVWMRLESGIRDWISELELYQYWNGLYILMVAGAIILIISFIGCCGALTNNILLMVIKIVLTGFTFVMLMFGAIILLANVIQPSFDYTFVTEQFNVLLNRNDYRSDNFMIWLTYVGAGCVIIIILLELAGTILVLLYGTESSELTPLLTRAFEELILDANYDSNSHYYLVTIQEKIGCCGSRNYMDYTRNNLPISDSCRDAISGNVFQRGCVERFSLYMQKRAGWISAIAIFVAVLQILLVVFTFLYVRSSRVNDTVQRKIIYREVPQN